MWNVNNRCSQEVKELYDELNKKYRYMINMKDEHIDNLHYVACQIRKRFTDLGYSDRLITDMLVHYLYGSKKRYKQLLWFCYGEYVVENLERNIEIPLLKSLQCIRCGEWFEVPINSHARMCPSCQKENTKNRRIKYNSKVKK